MCSQLRGTLNNCSVLQRYKQVFSQSHCQEDKIIIIVQWQTPRFFLFTSSCFFTPEIDQEMSNSERGLYGCILHSSGFGLEFYENAIFGKTKCWSDGHRVGIMQRVMLRLFFDIKIWSWDLRVHSIKPQLIWQNKQWAKATYAGPALPQRQVSPGGRIDKDGVLLLASRAAPIFVIFLNFTCIDKICGKKSAKKDKLFISTLILVTCMASILSVPQKSDEKINWNSSQSRFYDLLFTFWQVDEVFIFLPDNWNRHLKINHLIETYI